MFNLVLFTNAYKKNITLVFYKKLHRLRLKTRSHLIAIHYNANECTN